MEKRMVIGNTITPGTVSKILWHFTGGPVWNNQTKKQGNKPKKSAAAYNNLKSILKTQKLRLGSYKEIVKVVLPERRKYSIETKTVHIEKNVPVTIESSPVCCLSDIPAPNLHYHAQRYGKFAIGFHRNAITKAGFNPVFYTLEDTPIIRSIYEGFSSIKLPDLDTIRGRALSISEQASEIEDVLDNICISDDIWEIENEIDTIKSCLTSAKQSLEDFIAFVKTFNRKEFGTIYCEREWRSTSEYSFGVDDIAMIVLPKTIGNIKYFKNFVERVLPRLKLPRRIPIVPWDYLVEY